MKLLDLTLPSVAENLALDEAILEDAEHGSRPVQILRLWESPQVAVIVGRSSRVNVEVHCEECRRRGIPIFRRASGGAAVVIGPGCLMYSVVLSYERYPHLKMIDNAHGFVLETVARSLRPLAPTVRRQGISDLTIGDRKISGNSMRCKRDHLLYHGTVLYDFPLHSIASLLKSPPRQPDYRAGREHESFVTCLSATPDQIRQSLIAGWQADTSMQAWPRELVQQLVREKYETAEWNLKR